MAAKKQGGKFCGDLSAFSLFEVCQFLMIVRQTGTLTVRRDGKTATLTFSKGQIVRVVAPGLQEGEDAFFGIVTWLVGSFDYMPGPVAEPATPRFDHSTEGLLMEAARRIDEGEIQIEEDEEGDVRSRARAIMESHKHALEFAELRSSLGGDKEKSLDFQEEVQLEEILAVARAKTASCVYLRAGEEPKARIRDQVVSIGRTPVTQRGVDRIARRQFGDEDNEGENQVEGIRSLEKLVDGHGHVLLEHERSVEGSRLTVTLLSAAAPLLDAFGIEPDKIFRALLEPAGMLLVASPPRGGKSTLAASLTFAMGSLKPCHVVHFEESRRYHLMGTGGLLESRSLPMGLETGPSIPEQVWRRKADVLVIDSLRNRMHVRGALDAAWGGAMVVAALEAEEVADVVDRFLALVVDEDREKVASRLAGAINGILFVTREETKGDGTYRGQFIPRSKALVEAIAAGDSERIRQVVSGKRVAA